jgi:hypothetical protein
LLPFAKSSGAGRRLKPLLKKFSSYPVAISPKYSELARRQGRIGPAADAANGNIARAGLPDRIDGRPEGERHDGED